MRVTSENWLELFDTDGMAQEGCPPPRAIRPELILGKKIQALTAQRDALRTGDADFATRAAALDTREAELTAALNEMTADTVEEDRQAVEGAVNQLEADRAALSQEQDTHNQHAADIEAQIRALQQELDDLNARAANPAPAAPVTQPDP